MQTAPQGFFSEKANTMDGSSKLPNFPPDFSGEVQVDLCKGITTRKGDRAYIVEFTVLSSNMPSQVFVGGRYSWYQSLKEPDTAYPTCISFLYACLQLDPSNPTHKAKIDAEVKPKQNVWLNQSTNEDPAKGPTNVLKGSKVGLQTFEKKTKAGANMTIEEARMKRCVFTIHSFSPAKVAVAA